MKSILKAITLTLFLCVFCGQIDAQAQKGRMRTKSGGTAAATNDGKAAAGTGAKGTTAATEGKIRKAAPGTPEARAEIERLRKEGYIGPDPSNAGSGGGSKSDGGDTHVYEGKEAETLPAFRGGELAMIKFISSNLQYPKDHPARDVEGKTIVRFVVDKNGKLDNFEVVESLGESFDQEAINVLKKMPRWTPGRYRGKPANVYRQIPIPFK